MSFPYLYLANQVCHRGPEGSIRVAEFRLGCILHDVGAYWNGGCQEPRIEQTRAGDDRSAVHSAGGRYGDVRFYACSMSIR